MAGAGQRRAWRLAPLLLGGCLATAGGTGWGADVVRTDPQHLHPVPEDVIPGYVPEPPVLWTKKPLVVMRASTEWRKGGKLDRALTLACRAGRFLEITSMQYRAVFTDDVLGVAFGHGLNLYDPDHHANPATIYLFRFGGLNDCEVLTKPNEDPRVQKPAAGTSR